MPNEVRNRVPAMLGNIHRDDVRHAEIPEDAVQSDIRPLHGAPAEGVIPWDQDLHYEPTCQAVKGDGTACNANPITDEQFCWFHKRQQEAAVSDPGRDSEAD